MGDNVKGSSVNPGLISRMMRCRLGAEHGFLDRNHPLIPYPETVLNRLSIANPGITPRLFVLEHGREINCFALPDASVVATVGLFNAVRTEDELAFVFAHELTHISNRHGQIFCRDIIDGKWSISQATGRKRIHEYEADLGATASWLSRSGYHPLAGATFLENLQNMIPAGRTSGWDTTHGDLADRRLNILSLRLFLDLKGIEGLHTPIDPGWSLLVTDYLSNLGDNNPYKRIRQNILDSALSPVATDLDKLCSNAVNGSDEDWTRINQVLLELYEDLDREIKRCKAVEPNREKTTTFDLGLSPYKIRLEKSPALYRRHLGSANLIVDKLFREMSSRTGDADNSEMSAFLIAVLYFGSDIPFFSLMSHGIQSLDYRLSNGTYVGQAATEFLLDEGIEGFARLLDPERFRQAGVPYLSYSDTAEQKAVWFMNYCAGQAELFYDQGTGEFVPERYFRASMELFKVLNGLYHAINGEALDEALMVKLTRSNMLRYASLKDTSDFFGMSQAQGLRLLTAFAFEGSDPERMALLQEELGPFNANGTDPCRTLSSCIINRSSDKDKDSWLAPYLEQFSPENLVRDLKTLLSDVSEDAAFNIVDWVCVFFLDNEELSRIISMDFLEGLAGVISKYVPLHDKCVRLMMLVRDVFVTACVRQCPLDDDFMQHAARLTELIYSLRPDITPEQLYGQGDHSISVPLLHFCIIDDALRAIDAEGFDACFAKLGRVLSLIPFDARRAALYAIENELVEPDFYSRLAFNIQNLIKRLLPKAEGCPERMLTLSRLFMDAQNRACVADHAVFQMISGGGFEDACDLLFGRDASGMEPQ
ncbi:MAG: M48 family metallopeptidase [Candidatus Margulisiibacteriota bacterium]